MFESAFLFLFYVSVIIMTKIAGKKAQAAVTNLRAQKAASNNMLSEVFIIYVPKIVYAFKNIIYK